MPTAPQIQGIPSPTLFDQDRAGTPAPEYLFEDGVAYLFEDGTGYVFN